MNSVPHYNEQTPECELHHLKYSEPFLICSSNPMELVHSRSEMKPVVAAIDLWTMK